MYICKKKGDADIKLNDKFTIVLFYLCKVLEELNKQDRLGEDLGDAEEEYDENDNLEEDIIEDISEYL